LLVDFAVGGLELALNRGHPAPQLIALQVQQLSRRRVVADLAQVALHILAHSANGAFEPLGAILQHHLPLAQLIPLARNG
jgi:hypothetical protein